MIAIVLDHKESTGGRHGEQQAKPVAGVEDGPHQELMAVVRQEVRQRSKEFIEQMSANPPYRIPGTAVVLGRMTKGVPLALTQNLKHNHVLHQKVFLVAVEMTETPRALDEERVRVTPISEDIVRVELGFGFMEQPDVPKGLAVGTTRGQIAQVDLKNVNATAMPSVFGIRLRRRVASRR